MLPKRTSGAKASCGVAAPSWSRCLVLAALVSVVAGAPPTSATASVAAAARPRGDGVAGEAGRRFLAVDEAVDGAVGLRRAQDDGGGGGATPPTPSPSSHVLETPAPTHALAVTTAPTKAPTPSPSMKPSAKPTAASTKEPTPLPSSSPSRHPTSLPSDQPTHAPTQTPTTPASSAAPTGKPTTLVPTSSPSAAPTTAHPTKAPSASPSKQPSPPPSTASPTGQPTQEPTPSPTSVPSSPPSPFPSSSPTHEPSREPSKRPSAYPTAQPTRKPTRMPSHEPSQRPSSPPTAQPTKQPTRMPSHEPSSSPSLWPTDQPTSEPTKLPSHSPSIPPSLVPSAKPSVLSSFEPSPAPSDAPSPRPTRTPTTSPTVSAAPSSSVEHCLRDVFGIERIYASGDRSSNDWYAKWYRTERTLSGYDGDVDAIDSKVSVSGNGSVHINDGVATLQRSPQLQIYAGNDAGFGDVEMTAYARYRSGGAQRGQSGLTMAIKMAHPEGDCEMPSYRMHISLTGDASFQKEYRPDSGEGSIRSGKRTTSLLNSLPLEDWVGVKFVVRKHHVDGMLLELYTDLFGSSESMMQNWTLVHSYIDSAGSWGVSSSSLSDDSCSASLEDGAVFSGPKLYGIIENVGTEDSMVDWREMSIRGISETTQLVACTSASPTTLTPTSATPSTTPSFQPSQSRSPTPSPSVAKTLVPSTATSFHPSQLPSTTPTEATEADSVEAEADQRTEAPPSASPTKSYRTLSGVLSFNLPMERLLDSDEAAAFEETVEAFLGNRLTSRNVSGTTVHFSAYNATILSQALVTGDQSSSNTTMEPVRMLEDSASFLIIDAAVSAMASPADAAEDFPLNAVMHRVLDRNSEKFYDELFSAFNESPEQPLEYVDLNSRDSSSNKNIALGSSIAGIAMMLALVAAFFIMRHRHDRDEQRLAQEVKCDAPPAVCFDKLEEGDAAELSSLDEGSYPNNVPHLQLPDGKAADAETRKAEIEKKEQHVDQWSLDDTFPMMKKETDYLMHHSQMTDSDDESSTTSSTKADLKQEVFVPRDEDQSLQSDETEKFNRLYETVNTALDRDEELADAKDGKLVQADEETPAPAPRTARGLKMFSCFADNTFDEPTLTTQKILGRSFKSGVTPKASNTARDVKVRGSVYEVRCPPGPLGMIIDSSKQGPIIHEVKEGSPLSGMVDQGDVILSVDGVDCSAMDAEALGFWIASKPRKPEQLLTIMAHVPEEEMSV